MPVPVFSRLSASLRRFLRAEHGNAVSEGAMILPIMLWAAFGLYVFWDGYKSMNKLQKATYTVGDIVSRWQSAALTVTDANGLQTLMAYMISDGQVPRLRLTSVVWSGTNNRFEVQWSCSLDPTVLPPFTTLTVQTQADRIPTTPAGGTQILIESEFDYTPVFSGGIEAMTFNEFVPVRPRFGNVAFSNPTACN